MEEACVEADTIGLRNMPGWKSSMNDKMGPRARKVRGEKEDIGEHCPGVKGSGETGLS